MLGDAPRLWWAEPQVRDVPPRRGRDWALVIGLVPVAVIEAIARPDLVWRWGSVLVFLALLPPIVHRRSHPLPAVLAAFGLLTAVDVASMIIGVDWRGLDTNVVVLLLLYALFRWGSGRQAVLGLAFTFVPAALSGYDQQIHPGTAAHPSVANVVSGMLVLTIAGAVGMAVRFQDKARARTLDQVKLLEREQLARELHDTVAHHMSAIAIRAQAGRVIADRDPAGAVDALRVIEEEASRTLAEMRLMVGALRQGEADLTPQRGVAAIERLARHHGERPLVEVELSGDLEDLRPSVDAALYRLAQESITNAVRHARHATRVKVDIAGESTCVRLTVGDDGEPVANDGRIAAGYGLVGMAERAKLLGGTFEAGPNRNRGWTVQAVLPRAVTGA